VISFDTARNRIIVEDILNQAKNGKRILLLSERKEHLEFSICISKENAKQSWFPAMILRQKEL